MATDRTATAQWAGDLLNGRGTVQLETSKAAGPLEVSWVARTDDGPGNKTSPEELIAAAHAACFSMALSNVLNKAGNPPERLETTATVTFSTEGGAHIERVRLRVHGVVPGASVDDFAEAADTAKDNCPVSKALAGNVDISVDASLADV